MTELAIKLIERLARAGMDWLDALRKVNGMTEEEIDAAIVKEEARTEELMERWK